MGGVTLQNGAELKAWRERLKLSQAEAGALLGGVDRRTVMRWEAKGLPHPIEVEGAPAQAVTRDAPVTVTKAKAPPAPKGEPGAWRPKLDPAVIYGRFDPVPPKVRDGCARRGMVIEAMEVFESASGQGGRSIIVWGRRESEPQAATGPILCGMRYSPARVRRRPVGWSEPAADKASGGKRKRA